ncbi:MAG: hypothetical protein K8W52_31360 [Deltaproteobacteria bacterium]|nr:hypothetical protein [Deltaproteobacteria bacterium]
MSFHAINALFDSLGESVSPNSCDVVVIDGRLDHARLRAAIAQTLARHPILCRPLGARDGIDHDLPIDLRFHALPDDAARVDAHLLAQIWDEPLDRGGRPVRFHVTETPTRTYLQTIHTHVYADATACYTLTEQLAAAYAGHVSIDDEMPALAWPQPRLREAVRMRLRGLAQLARDLVRPFSGLAVPAHRPGARKMTRIVLDERETAQLRRVARERGHSIHACFQLAMLRAAHAYNAARGVDRPTVRLWDFFSLRPMLETTGPRYDCLALIYPVDLDARWSDAETTAHCAEVVQRMRGGELAVHAQRLDSMFRAAGRRSPMPGFARLWPSLFKSNVFLTNPGVCPSTLPRFGDAPVIDYVTFPQLFAPADVMFVFSTFRDRLRIHVVHDEAAFAGEFHEGLLRPFLRELDAQAGLHLDAPMRDGFVATWTARPAPTDKHRALRTEAHP